MEPMIQLVPGSDRKGTVLAVLPCLIQHLELLDSVYGKLRPTQPYVTFLVVMIRRLLMRMAELVKEGDLYTANCIGRPILETTVNFCYVAVVGQAAYDQMDRHMKHRELRDLRREVSIGTVTTVTLEVREYGKLIEEPSNKELLAQFTTRAGREARSWTNLTIQQRMAVVLSKKDPPMQLDFVQAFMDTYRTASDILHGTLYGAARGWGLPDPMFPGISREPATVREEGVVTLAWSLSLFLGRAIMRISEALESAHDVKIVGMKENMQTLINVMDDLAKSNLAGQARERHD